MAGRELHWDGFNFGPQRAFSDVWEEPAATQGSWGGLLPATFECELTAVG